MGELFEKEKPKRPEHCPKCGSVNIFQAEKGFIDKKLVFVCNDCMSEIK